MYDKTSTAWRLSAVFNPTLWGLHMPYKLKLFYIFFVLVNRKFCLFIKQDSPNILLSNFACRHCRIYTPSGFYWGYSLPAIVFWAHFFSTKQKYSMRFAAKHAIFLSFFVNALGPWQTRNYLTFGYYDFTSNKGCT